MCSVVFILKPYSLPQPIPKSSRLNVAVDSVPHTSFFSIGCMMHLNDSIFRFTGFVTPCSVSSPITSTGTSPLNFIDLQGYVDEVQGRRAGGSYRRADP